jgi:alkylhydroperoxidase family enzyme
MNTNVTEMQINDLEALNDVAVDLSEEELQAVAGAMMSVSWKCGSSHLADEWTV